MKKLLGLISLILAACSTPANKPPAPEAVPVPADQPVASNTTTAIDYDLSDFDSMIFACPKAALNAAAREAKKAATMGSYQFSYFRIVSSSHHSQYEVHFTSNVHDEPELKYCVSIYCQQGWDPNNAKTDVQLMGGQGISNKGIKKSVHQQHCEQLPVGSRLRKKS